MVQAGRHADALLTASCVGGELWERARGAYMAAHPRPFMRVLHASLGGDWAGGGRGGVLRRGGRGVGGGASAVSIRAILLNHVHPTLR